jgi:O-antigen/teichoic acid export membrane protein
MSESIPLTRKFVVRNIAELFSGSAIAQALTALTFLLMARQLGASVYGTFTSSLVLASITALVFNLGLDLWLMHSAGKNPAKAAEYMGSIFGLKLFFSVLWFVLLLLIQPFLDTETFPPAVLFWTAGIVWLDSLFLTILSGFKAALQNRYTLILEPASDVLWLAGTLVLIFFGMDALLPYLQLRFGVLLISLLAAGILIWRRNQPAFHQNTARLALRETPPYALSELLAMTTMRMDLLIVALVLGSAAAGLYSPALSVVNALFFVPAAIANVMIPVLSRLYREHPVQARKTALRQTLLQLAVGIGMFVVFLAASPLMVRFLGESYDGLAPLLVVLSFVLLLKPLTFAGAAMLVASGNQQPRLYIQVFAAALSIALDLLAVSYFGLTAVAVVYVVVEACTAAGYYALAWLLTRHQPDTPAPGTPSPSQREVRE